MRTHDDRPGGAGGYPDDRSYGAHAQQPGAGAQGARSTQSLGSSKYDYYDDDDGYSDAEATSLVDPGGREEEAYYDDLGRTRKPFGWSGSTDLGLLILRLSLGGLFLVHGAQKLFGVLGGPGPEGFAQALAKMGFQQSAMLSLVTGATELGAGALLVLGLFTPLAAAGVVGVMANAIFLKLGAGFFNATGGFEFEATLLVLGLGLMFTGPGRVALDYGRVWFRRPLTFGFISLIIAAGAAVAVLLLFHRP
ncbi:putative oxidoreductase [Saccharopolyspora kobensis]|uniref:Oxidoreductase n=1 Tax=Saccharopolyspora kobensis TaxID=146035 RepID=A0A1H6BLM0_9PSEU|nr:DoxX family protein [Saccharopolyspora kobensis]SEG61345.1 putative oxidoreductase [Saccharopolyspora kobensis]SFE86842.1 putative oxidoreductase [Saccharopolyspora kobensis]